MKKLFLVGLIGLIAYFILGTGVIYAEPPTTGDIANNALTYRGETVTVAGEITTIIDRIKLGFYLTDLNNPSQDTKKTAAEINLYYIADQSGGIYIISLKHFEQKQQVSFRANVLATSMEELDDNAVMAFDMNIIQKCGLSAPTYSQATLQGLIDKLPRGQDWVLAIDVE